MNQVETEKKWHLDFLKVKVNLLDQVQTFENFPGILLKTQKDGYLENFFNTFNPIFKSEREYTLSGRLKRNQKMQSTNPKKCN